MADNVNVGMGIGLQGQLTAPGRIFAAQEADIGLNIRSPRFVSPAASRLNASKYNTWGKYGG